MSIQHHPSDELFLDYASGALDEGSCVAVATHLALCPDSRQRLAEIEAVGAAFMESLSPSPILRSSSDAVFSALSTENIAVEDSFPSDADDSPFIFPQPLRGYIGGDLNQVPWQRIGLGSYQALLQTGDTNTVARLLKIPAGKAVPAHSHAGTELTLVLCGAFTDKTGHYGRGDFQEADEELEHQPYAVAGEDCICLAVTDAPLKFSSLAARLVQPLIGI
tara:strand:- start:3589 stop:4248 length:660 start_codon:yes stop_codon:yes gene_type:complete